MAMILGWSALTAVSSGSSTWSMIQLSRWEDRSSGSSTSMNSVLRRKAATAPLF